MTKQNGSIAKRRIDASTPKYAMGSNQQVYIAERVENNYYLFHLKDAHKRQTMN